MAATAYRTGCAVLGGFVERLANDLDNKEHVDGEAQDALDRYRI